jgi:hypothetical protein
MFMVPVVYHITDNQLQRDGDNLKQELRLLFAFCGAPILPIGLFWMGWTAYVSIYTEYMGGTDVF